MKRLAIGVAAVAMAISLSSCSSFDGTITPKIETFEDDAGRTCTTVKYGQSSSIDCDYPPVPVR